MSRTVIINAMCCGWQGEKPADAEIWGVNRTFKVESRLDRVYFFDPHTLFEGDLLADLRALDIPVYTREPLDELPKSLAFPLEDIQAYFGIESYWTCTLAYMLAHAVYEHCNGKPIDRLILNGMFHPRDSVEYLWSKPCVEFWLGVAMGRGMNVTIQGFNALCKPLPWESGLYGYRRNVMADLCIQTISAAYEACYQYPRKFVNAQEEIVPMEDVEGLYVTRKKLEAMLKQVNDALAAQPVKVPA